MQLNSLENIMHRAVARITQPAILLGATAYLLLNVIGCVSPPRPVPTPTRIPPTATATPRPLPTFTPTTTPTPIPTPTETPTPEWLNSLATIRQYTPELADIISQQEWFKDGITGEESWLLGKFGSLATGLREDLMKLRKNQPCLYDLLMEEQPWFSNGSIEKIGFDLGRKFSAVQILVSNLEGDLICEVRRINHPSGIQKRIAFIYDKKINSSLTMRGRGIYSEKTYRVEALEWIVKTLDEQYTFLGMEMEQSFWSTLVVLADYKHAGAVSSGTIGLAAAPPSLHGTPVDFLGTISHEVAHIVVGGGNFNWPLWYEEGLATLLSNFPTAPEIQPTLEDMYEYFKRLHSLKSKPLDNYLNHQEKDAGDAYGRSMVILLDYRNLAGHAAFQSTVQESVAVKRQSQSTPKEPSAILKEIFIKNAPDSLKEQVSKMYDAAVFGK